MTEKAEICPLSAVSLLIVNWKIACFNSDNEESAHLCSICVNKRKKIRANVFQAQ